MGLALEVFDFRIWFVYVAATVVLESWIIGRCLEVGWGKSLLVSCIANACTCFCCAGGFFAPFLVDLNPKINDDPSWTIRIHYDWGTRQLDLNGFTTSSH